MSRLTCAFVLFLAAVITPTGRGQASLVFGNEVFITMDADSVSGWLSDWWEFKVEGPSGVVETLELIQPSNWVSPIPLFAFDNIGAGQYGAIYACPGGDWVYEPFWFSQAFGPHGGVLHPVVCPVPDPFNGALSVFEQTAGLAPGHRQGLRFARADGRPFAFRGLDYRNAASDFLIGIQLDTYNDFAGYQVITPMLGSNTWQTLSLPAAPSADLDSLAIDPTSPGGAVLQINPAAGTFSVQGIIASYVRGDGMLIDDPLVDPLVGGMIIASGTVAGATFTATTVTLMTPAATDRIDVTGALIANPAHTELAGPHGTFPFRHRTWSTAPNATLTRTGSGSPALDGLWLRLPFEPLTLRFREVVPGTLRLASIEKPWTPPLGLREAVYTDGTGLAELAIAGAPPGAIVRNLFDVQPTMPVGTGPLLGLGFTPSVLSQLTIPLGVAPFHDLVDVNGDYFWGVPPGSVPPGTVVDHLRLLIYAGQLDVAPVQRITF